VFGNLFFNFNGRDMPFSASVSMFALNGSSTLSLDFALNDVSAVAMPPSPVLFGSGLLGLAGLRRVRCRRQAPTD